MNSVSEQIDERILRLLGLDDVFDLDYDTYLTLLKEAIVTGANKIPQEELALLANERKRVRGRKGRFKPKKEKITADKIATTKFLKPTKKTLALPASISKPADSSENLSGFGKPLQSIAKTLSAILKFNKKSKEDERKDKESEKRTKREEGLEGFKKGISAVSGATRKLLAPFQSIIDRIWKFIFFTLLGRAFTQLMEWLGDPKNKRKIEVLGRFLKDWWPTLLGAAVLFFTPFGKFVRTTLKIVGFFTGKLIKVIPQIANAIKGLAANPFFAIPAAAIGTAAIANEITGQRKAAPVQAENKARAQTGKGLGVQGVGGVGDMGPTTPYGLLQGAMNGGTVMNGYGGIDGKTGQKVSGFGPDTQMIAAQPGEIVMNKKTVNAIGADNLLALNRQYGGPGANKPKMGKMFNTGGMVGGNPKMEDVMRQAHSSTVRIERGDGFGESGSGVLVRNNNGTYSVLTAGHVLKGYVPGEEGNTIKIITPDGKSHDIDPKSVKLGQNDLGSLKFKSDQNYMVARPGDPTKMKKGDQTFVGGYPIDPKTGFQDKVLRFSTGQVVDPNSTDPNALSGGQTLRYSNQTQKGMSGGFVFNSRGELIGIHGQSSAKGFISGSGAVPISSSMGTFGSTDNRTPYTSPELTYLKLSEEQQKKAAKTYEASSGAVPDYGGPTGDQFIVGNKKDTNARLLSGFKGGGLIGESTGMNIKGATADRQLAALQPGEFVITAGAVSKFGIDFFEKINSVDYDSNAAKIGKKSINRPSITPLSRAGMGGMMTLPPITQSAAGSPGSGSAAGSKVPSFSTVSPSGGEERFMNASIYGIVG